MLDDELLTIVQKDASLNLYNDSYDLDDPTELSLRYGIKSCCLKWNEEKKTLSLIRPNKAKDYEYDFRGLYFPATTGSPIPTSIASNDDYINVLLSLIDQSVDAVKINSKDWTKAVSKPIQTFMYVMTFLRNKGIYKLKAVNSVDMQELPMLLGKGGWHGVLQRDELWEKVISELENRDVDKLDLFSIAKGSIYSLKSSFWLKYIGYGACSHYSNRIKKQILKYCENKGYSIHEKFLLNLQKSTIESTKTTKSLYMDLININKLAIRRDDIDCLFNIPFSDPGALARKYCKHQGRTKNLAISDATYMIKKSFELVFEFGPKFIDILKTLNHYKFPTSLKPGSSVLEMRAMKNCSEVRQRNFFKLFKPFDELTCQMGLPPVRTWSISTNNAKPYNSMALVELVALFQGACCLIILCLNARRVGEVIDPETGIRTTDLKVINDDLGIYQCLFYIEKTYQDRHTFYVSKSTAYAIQFLSEMKSLLADFFGNKNSKLLFSVCALTLRTNTRKNRKPTRYFEFDNNGNALSISTLLRYLYPDGDEPVLTSHMGRRFFALLYHYRYDNGDLLSLKQHLRHLLLTMTKIYVTDPDFRDEAKNIVSSIGNRHESLKVDTALYESLELEIEDLENIIDDVGQERLTDVVTRIIEGKESAGGFTRYVRKLFRQLAKNVEFSDMSSVEQGETLSGRLRDQGYKTSVMSHGQCNVPDRKDVLRAKCGNDKQPVNKERACASLCRQCKYHYNNPGFMESIRDDAAQLKEDMNNFLLPPLQQKKAQGDYDNLIRIIELNEKKMDENKILMIETREVFCE